MTARTALSAYAVLLAALGAVLFIPLLFSDPNGVDPNGLRLSATACGLCLVTVPSPRLRPMRPLALSMVAVVLPFTLWSVVLQITAGSGGTVFALAGGVQVVTTVAVIGAIWRLCDQCDRPSLRMRRFTSLGMLVSAAGLGAFAVAALALPAPLLGRDGIALPSAAAAFSNGLIVGDLLQAFAQELQFRGVLLGSLERVLSPLQANIAQSVLFGLGHLALPQYEGPIVTLIPVTIALGVGFGWITQKTQSIWPAVILHAAIEVALRVAVLPGLYGA